MRSSKNRSRSKGNRNRSMGNIVNRVFDSSGPEGKVRGTPQQIIDKYNQLARDAQLSNDRVAAENFQQHAEHYTRMLGEAQREQDARRAEQEAQQQQAREARQARDESDQPRESQPGDQPQPQGGEQKSFGDVIDVPSGESGLVQTPESAPKPKRARTRRAPKKAEDQPQPDAEGAASPSSEDPQAAE
ncbi:DUF4167 domain-containing protein [Nioella sp.]|uniref:DUF4167 domain-containing protein n=1 Tax=Nioella sp. TaxID=1912091 RepID=UPI003516D48F